MNIKQKKQKKILSQRMQFYILYKFAEFCYFTAQANNIPFKIIQESLEDLSSFRALVNRDLFFGNEI